MKFYFIFDSSNCIYIYYICRVSAVDDSPMAEWYEIRDVDGANLCPSPCVCSNHCTKTETFIIFCRGSK